jgi:hypothetical protein
MKVVGGARLSCLDEGSLTLLYYQPTSTSRLRGTIRHTCRSISRDSSSQRDSKVNLAWPGPLASLLWSFAVRAQATLAFRVCRARGNTQHIRTLTHHISHNLFPWCKRQQRMPVRLRLAPKEDSVRLARTAPIPRPTSP